MKVLNKAVDLDGFWKRLSRSNESVLFLDYDGTLAPFKVDRDKAVPYPWVPAILDRILEAGRTRIVIITGRQVVDIEGLLVLSHPVEIWGCHGREHLLKDGEIYTKRVPKPARMALSSAHKWVDGHGLADNMEEKNGCLALHFRGMEKVRARDVEREAKEAFEALLPGSGMELESFDGGIELRTCGCNKGHAVRTVLSSYSSVPPSAYLGDDLTDEDAFKAIKGVGLGILVRNRFRPTSADMWIRPPDELRAFLERWEKETRGG